MNSTGNTSRVYVNCGIQIPNTEGIKRKTAHIGFTLIELLVVIAVISVLLAILLPALHKVRQLNQRTVCQTRLKNLSMAWGMYFDENEGAFYQGVNANLNYGGWPGWMGWWPRPLNPYVGIKGTEKITEDAAEAFCCPGDRGGIPPDYNAHYKTYQYWGTSYQTNIFLIGPDACGTFSENTKVLDAEISKSLKDLNINDVYSPSLLLLLGDYGWVNQWDPGSEISEECKECAKWHGRDECFNLVFLDGHCGLIKIKKGIYVDDDYSILPFKDLYGLAKQDQIMIPDTD